MSVNDDLLKREFLMILGNRRNLCNNHMKSISQMYCNYFVVSQIPNSIFQCIYDMHTTLEVILLISELQY